MDAVKFIEEHRRMYKVTGKHLPTLAEGIPAEDVVKEIEEWSAAHPRKTRKTRQDVLLERYPDIQIFKYYLFCPQKVNRRYKPEKGCDCTDCTDCCREFWMQEVK